ncbi:peptidylprolyl isomerase [Desulfonatronum thioautotrophicum]|uniref:peptidylprolyl isomerase n=1 Tax=Desulfonatronum thioautotrophicum TaxID=617001 RepID=UPI0005EB1B07|nr:peptidylprolyl isomerase [Desulfonatronum thioautotrophicum]
MLDAIRRNAQSWGVKVIFGIIILVFVFWGVGSFRSERGDILAEINGSPLLLEDFQRVYRQTLDNLRQENPNISVEELERMDFRGQIFGQMVNAKLMEQEATRLGINVTAQELRQSIVEMLVFRDQDDRFSPAQYQAVLRAHNLTPAQFERDFRGDLKIQRLGEFIGLPATISDQDARDFFTFAQEETVLNYLSFPWTMELDRFEVDEEAIEAHYQANVDTFQVPPRIRIAYLHISPAELADPTRVTQEEIEAYYTNMAHEFAVPEQVHARHILITPEDDSQTAEDQVREKLVQLLVRMQAGESFAELAREYSDDASAAQGGDLGWFGRGEMVDAFEDAAFALEPGHTSEPVRTPFGWHLIQVQERRDSGVVPLEDVAGTIRARLAEEHGLDRLAEALDLAMEQLIVGESLETAAEMLDLPLRTTDFFPMGQSPAELDLTPEAVAVLFGLQDGETTQTPLLLADGYLLARRIDFEPQHVRPLEDVRERILTQLRLDMAKEAARAKAEQALELIHAEDPQAYDPEELQTSAAFGRQGFIPGLGFHPSLGKDAFTAEIGEWLPQVYQLQDAFIVARVHERIAPSEELWLAERADWRSALLQSRQREFLQAFVAELYRAAEIRVLRQDVLRPASR